MTETALRSDDGGVGLHLHDQGTFLGLVHLLDAGRSRRSHVLLRLKDAPSLAPSSHSFTVQFARVSTEAEPGCKCHNKIVFCLHLP